MGGIGRRNRVLAPTQQRGRRCTLSACLQAALSKVGNITSGLKEFEAWWKSLRRDAGRKQQSPRQVDTQTFFRVAEDV